MEMSRCTTFARSLIKAGALLGSIALATTFAIPAFAASGPQQVLYIFPGATDSGTAAGTGTASVVHCFSFSPGQEILQIVVRNFDGSVLQNVTIAISQFETLAVVTHATNLYAATSILLTGELTHGVFGISATSSNIVCTAQVIDASATVPNGIDLHGARFNPISGSQE
jgi:hypothetical protein